MINKINAFLLLTILIISCNPKKEVNTETKQADSLTTRGSVESAPFGTMPDGTQVSVFTLTNSNGVKMKVINYGGIITSLSVPDKNNKIEDIVLGFDELDGYLKDSPFFGALIGRYGNRIAKGKFTLDGKSYSLAVNNGANHLHGGNKGFDKVFWNIKKDSTDNGVAIKLSYTSKDMEEGYPGNLQAEVTYTLTDNNELQIDYKATTDKKTVVNLTQHTYFNLTGGKQDILSHHLLLNADRFLPVDKTLIPTGELKPVSNTPFDFTKSQIIGSRISNNDEQLKIAGGYDHCWVLNKATDGLNTVGTLYDSISGREVTVYTTEPGVQFYSGNFLDGSITGKSGVVYNKRYGLCLETQHFPDSPNKPEFPSVVLNPGETYTSQTVYKFSVR
ncbi:aldose epimerase family protein [Chryseosolibacter indicus]|uniref:Aldose 1-epimerase n=1 Tax=Chryseosolibacter indicus TaxID=2782351 RepID=A0ABS5VR06_9BACT|nr:aldose epimerase family protein [Chryseosolibacter indicus]MBT1703586.1 galactose mutarotase [Chryseosolibacter indicus]